jgi:anti-sigma regulatory factor (Ser/Thr protein kinase)
MTNQLELTLLNRQPEIARAQDELERFAAAHNVSGRPLYELQLALEEHLANIVNYAYEDNAPHHITVRFGFKSPEIRIQIQDDGRPFNPLDHPPPGVSLPVDQKPVGGLGIHMMRKSVDGLEYRRESDRNILEMIKRV